MKQGETSLTFSTGKVDFHLYPEVYFTFWSEVDKHHQDLMRAMQLAQVKLSDGSAIDFLNTFLGTNVGRFTPMEIGYAQFLDALRMRVRNKHAETNLQNVAASFKDDSLFPARSDPSKPIFDDEGKKQ